MCDILSEVLIKLHSLMFPSEFQHAYIGDTVQYRMYFLMKM